MPLLQTLSKLWNNPSAKYGSAPAAEESQPDRAEATSLFDVPRRVNATALGVKYASRYSWQIYPPAGWRRQDNSSSAPSCPTGGLSPYVSFTHPNVLPGRQCILRWQLLSVPETNESHSLLQGLLYGPEPCPSQLPANLSAPGLVAGMKLLRMERMQLPSGEAALLVSSKMQECKGEPAVLRYILIFSDREIPSHSQCQWYRESLQFIATEDSFWSHEGLAVESLKTFRRNLPCPAIAGATPVTSSASSY